MYQRPGLKTRLSVLGQNHQLLLAAPGLEQVLKGLADDGLTLAAADLFNYIELFKVLVDKKLAHSAFRDIDVLTMIFPRLKALLLGAARPDIIRMCLVVAERRSSRHAQTSSTRS